jgi:protein-disulfide isomerase
MSGRRDREARREEERRSEQTAADQRRQRLIKLSSALAFLVLAAVAVLIVISSNSSSGGDSEHIVDVKLVDRQLAGIPQRGMVLGQPSAKAKLLEFGDLKCPVCKGYSEEILPEVIESRVRSGEATVEFRNYTIIGPQSTPAGAAAIAAGKQSRGWNYVEIFYRNQGPEDLEYADDKFLTAVARAAGVPDIARWNRDRRSARLTAEVEATTAEAEELGFTGTPSFAVEGPGVPGTKTLGSAPAGGDIESAIEEAAG